VYYTAKEAFGRGFDYNTFWAKATQHSKVICAFAYAINRGDEKQLRFQNMLRAIGFEVKLKQYIQRSDGSSKGDWDVGITIDMLEWADKVDSMILVSGDGDFAILVDTLRKKHNIDVTVYGTEKLTAHALINSANAFCPVEGNLLMKK
jgi:uncharacterized LabA/DUF88 family protein